MPNQAGLPLKQVFQGAPRLVLAAVKPLSEQTPANVSTDFGRRDIQRNRQRPGGATAAGHDTATIAGVMFAGALCPHQGTTKNWPAVCVGMLAAQRVAAVEVADLPILGTFVSAAASLPGHSRPTHAASGTRCDTFTGCRGGGVRINVLSAARRRSSCGCMSMNVVRGLQRQNCRA